jgi:hypothetical protein
MMLSLGLLLQIASSPLAAMPGVIGMPTDPHTDSLRKAETRFLIAWRREWMIAPKLPATATRLAALHCHHDGSWQSGTPNIIRSASSRRSFCPIWFPVDDSLRSDESKGIDASLTEDSREMMRRARGQLITRFGRAAAAMPENPWVAGQLVRLNVDQQDYVAALAAARGCRESKPWCLLLEGYVRHRDGRVAAADSLFSQSVSLMDPADRCSWTSIAPLLDARSRGAYERIPCDARDSVDAAFWWLADPLYIEPGNARRAEHFARQVLVRLHAALTIDERWDWRPRYGGDALAAMIVRYGWPSTLYWAGLREDGGHFEWLGFRDSSLNVAAEYTLPRFHTVPPWRSVLDPSTLRAADWHGLSPRQGYGATDWENDEWPTEHVPRARGAIVDLPEQTVLFRRDHDALLAIGLDMPLRFLAPGARSRYDAAIVIARDANDRWTPARTSVTLDGTTTTVLTSPISARAQVISAELAPADGAEGVAARARRSVHPPAPLSALQPGELAISDPLFFRPTDGGEPPTRTDDAISRMFGSLTLAGKRAGVFWETYGVPPGDTVDVTLRLISEDRPGLLRRLGTRLGVVRSEGGSIAVSWREPRTGERGGITFAGDVPIQPRSVVLDISRLRAGRYTVEISVSRPRGQAVSARRTIVVQQ